MRRLTWWLKVRVAREIYALTPVDWTDPDAPILPRAPEDGVQRWAKAVLREDLCRALAAHTRARMREKSMFRAMFGAR